MKRFNGFSTVAAIVILAIIGVIGVGTSLILDGNSKSIDFSSYDFYSIIPGDEHNGQIGDHVKGDKNAPVVIFEYADFQCPGCASMNPRVNAAIEKANGKLAIVYRNFLLSYHKNGTAAASAAEAAGLQGYYKEYADKLFSEQAEWEYADASERTALFNKYFDEVTDKKGDLEKFKQDISSTAVSQKISFDMGIGKRVDISVTPSFYIDGQKIDWSNQDGGEIVINGKTISWDSPRSGEHFTELLLKIVDAKTK